MSIDQLVPIGASLLLLMLVYSRWIAARLRRLLGLRKPGQIRRERAAGRVLKRLTTLDRPEKRLAYLRKIDPFTFEELVLTAFARRGQKIQRNRRYTGDGGIDGQVWINGKRYLIQAKRYRNHINARHVRDFCALVDQQEAWGIFVHTGRTGKQSRTLADEHERVTIISGRRLLKLLAPNSSTASRPAQQKASPAPVREDHSTPPGRSQAPPAETTPHQSSFDI